MGPALMPLSRSGSQTVGLDQSPNLVCLVSDGYSQIMGLDQSHQPDLSCEMCAMRERET